MTPLDEALSILAAGGSLDTSQANGAVGTIMTGHASEAAIASFLTALRVKGETAAELAGAVQAVREQMTPLEGQFPPLLDTCGTGGDGANTLNISTAAAVVVAACGVAVAKHGNRSATSRSSSATVLAELGVAYDLEPSQCARCLAELGITFLFAPRFHPAMRFAAPVRQVLPFRTLFNLIGPLANPARPRFQLLGVPNIHQAELVAGALAELGERRAAVVTGSDGLDEVTLGGSTHVHWVEDGKVRLDEWTALSFQLPAASAQELHIDGPAESAERIKSLLSGAPGPARNVVLANAAAALLVAGRVGRLPDGVQAAAAAIDSGAARDLLQRWAHWTQEAARHPVSNAKI
jgi:anthranilate phosphoribosyltransferase